MRKNTKVELINGCH